MLKRGAITYGNIYIMRMLNNKKKHHIQNHHKPGLACTMKNPVAIMKETMMVVIKSDFHRSVIHSFIVVVVKPYLFSMTNVWYSLKGIIKTVSA